MKRKDLILDANALAAALEVGKSGALAAMRNGRCSAWFAKLWAAKHCNVIPHDNTNNKDFNSWHLGSAANVVALTSSGLNIVRSGNKGKNRSNPDDAQESLERLANRITMWVVVDVTLFPHVTLVMIDGDEMRDFVQRGLITIGGIKRNTFYKMIE